MSLPKLPNPDTIPSQEDALSAIITSIAMEEVAIARILEAESEKIILATKHVKLNCTKDMGVLLQANESARNLIAELTDMQFVLKRKLQLAVGALPEERCPPQPKCVSVFCAPTQCLWSPCKTICLKRANCCGDGLRLRRRQGDCLIILPPNRNKYEVAIILKLISKTECPAEMELRQENHSGEVFSKRYVFHQKKQTINIHDQMILDAEQESLLSLTLLSAFDLEVRAGEIRIAQL